MNVIISNNQKEKIEPLNIEVIKRLDGEYNVDEVIETFKNMFYSRMILDVTALKNYNDISNLQKLSISLDMDKMILLLEEGSEMTSPSYLSKLISLGIYNFTTTTEGLIYLLNNPNTYRDVAQYHNITESVEQQPQQSQQPQVQIITQYETAPTKEKVILGIKNITKEAGSTTLTYMIKKALEKKYDVVAIQIDKKDFSYFNDKDLISTGASQMSDTLSSNLNKDIILIDLDDNDGFTGACTDIIYLIEPTTIKLNKLLLLKPNVLKELKGKKIVLNMCTLNQSDIKEFEYEANIDVFASLPALDERKQNEEITNLLQKLKIF